MFIALFARQTAQDARSLVSPDKLAKCFPDGMPSDCGGQWSDAHAVMAGSLIWNTAPSRHEQVPEICPRTGRIILAWARLDNRAELCGELGLAISDTLTDPQIILAAHAQFGEDCVEKLDGDFSFVIYDPVSQTGFCARDIMGAKPLFFCVTEAFVLVATSAAMIKKSGLVSLTPNPRWVVQTLAMNAFEPESTAYQEIKRLPCAHAMTFNPAEILSPKRYFSFRTDAPFAATRDPKWVERHRDAFYGAVERRAHSAFRIGAEYSAGLDSTSVLARLMDVLPHSRDEFHCFADLGTYQEAQLLLPSALKFDVRHTHVLTRHNRLQLGEDYTQSLDVIGYPVEHMQTLMHKSFLEMAQRLGIRTLFSGFGGDEVATNRASYVSWELLDRGAYGAVFDMRPGSFADRAMQLARMRFGRGRPDAGEDLSRTFGSSLAEAPFREGVIEQFGLHEHINSLVEPISGIRTQSEICGHSPYSTIAPMVRLESYTLFARQFGIEYRWPMLDRTLVQNYLLTPAIEKRHREWGRYLHRRAMDGIVPDEVNWYPSKYLGDPVGVAQSTPLPPKADAMDLQDTLADLIEPDRLDGLYDAVSKEIASETYDVFPMLRKVILITLIRINMWLSA
ncbi:MAG: asparagine synthase-related protein [Pseudomonadota bacterium]